MLTTIDAYKQMSTVRWPVSDIHYQMPTFRYPLSDAYYQIPTIRCLLSDAYCQMPTISCLPSDAIIRCLLSYVRFQMPIIRYLLSYQMHTIRCLPSYSCSYATTLSSNCLETAKLIFSHVHYATQWTKYIWHILLRERESLLKGDSSMNTILA